jgi:hypothetical protein
VRTPFMPRGSAVIVTRYRAEAEKVALVNPEDLAMLEESHDFVQALGKLAHARLTEAAHRAIELEDRPRAEARVEDPEQIAEILNL